MQSVQPDNADPMPLRQSSHGMGTLMIRFVGLLAVAVVADDADLEPLTTDGNPSRMVSRF